MDTTRIYDEVNRLDRRVHELSSDVRTLQMEALTKIQAMLAALCVFCGIIVLAGIRHHLAEIAPTNPPAATPAPGSSAARCSQSPAPRPRLCDSAQP